MNELQVFLVDDEARARAADTTVYAGDRYPYHGHFVPGDANSIGYEDLKVIENYEFLSAVTRGEQHEPGFAQALQYVSFQSAWLRSCETGGWQDTSSPSRFMTAVDYSLTGESARDAVDHGLANAEWFQPSIDPATLAKTAPGPHQPAPRSRSWCGSCCWSLPACGPGRRCGHGGRSRPSPSTARCTAGPPTHVGTSAGTARRSGRGASTTSSIPSPRSCCSDGVALVALPPSHRHDHRRARRRDRLPAPAERARDDLDVHPHRGRADDVLASRQARLRRIDADAAEFVPENEHRKIVWELAGDGGDRGRRPVWSLVAWSPLPILFIGGPSIYGAWLMVFFGITQHAGLRRTRSITATARARCT